MTLLRCTARALAQAWEAAPIRLIAMAVCAVATGLAPVATVWLLKVLIDALSTGSSAALVPAAVGFVVVGLVATVIPPLVTFLGAELERAIGRNSLSALYLATARCAGLSRLEDPTFQDRLMLARQSGRSGPGEVVDGLIGLFQAVLAAVGMLAVLVAISPLAAVLTVLGLLPALVAEIHLSRSRAALMYRLSPTERREFFYAQLQTSVAAGKELRLLGLSELFRLRMLDELGTADRQRRVLDRRSLRTQCGLGVLSAVILGGGITWAIIAAGRGTLSIGDVSAFVAALGALQSGLAALVARISMLHNSLLMYGNYLGVLDAEPDLPLPADPRPVPELRRGIELRDVWFRYGPDHDWILRGVNLTISHGRATALVGLNGAGKSTLVKLLCRFYDPDRGAILWDGVDLREVSVTELRERIGALFQDYMSYEMTAGENIGLGDVAALHDEPRIRAAAGRAGIEPTVDRLPRGYATMLSRSFAGDTDPDADPDGESDPDTGVLLSGGQWQRLALARTFLRDRRDLLILDEPSSGLDADAEAEIHQSLRRHRAGATSVLISHRLGAVRDAEHIAVLSGGQITEEGDHRQLLALDGVYARLFGKQAQGYRAEDAAAPELV